MMKLQKQKIIKIAIHETLKNGVDRVSITDIAQTTGFNEQKLHALFPQGDQELLMDTVQYAGELWIGEIKKSVRMQEDISRKLSVLAYGYVLGSKDHPQSLSIYIDLWKIIKDQNEPYIKQRLKDVYKYYINEFINIVKEIGLTRSDDRELRALAVLMTALSDALHIQSICLENEVDFEGIVAVVNKIVKKYLLGSMI